MILLLETLNVQVLWGSEAADADEFGKISDFRVTDLSSSAAIYRVAFLGENLRF
jgi:hypothetical protein